MFFRLTNFQKTSPLGANDKLESRVTLSEAKGLLCKWRFFSRTAVGTCTSDYQWQISRIGHSERSRVSFIQRSFILPENNGTGCTSDYQWHQRSWRHADSDCNKINFSKAILTCLSWRERKAPISPGFGQIKFISLKPISMFWLKADLLLGIYLWMG